MQSVLIRRSMRNSAIAVARCLRVVVLSGAMLSPMSSVIANARSSEMKTANNVTILPVAQTDTDGPHVLAASYYSVKDNLKATITLNNKAPRILEVQPTLFSLTGEKFNASSVWVDAASFRVVDLSELIANAPPDFQQGSIQLLYHGMGLMLGAQVKYDHESFKQHFSVRFNNKDYILTTVVSVSRGKFSGTYQVNVPITTP